MKKIIVLTLSLFSITTYAENLSATQQASVQKIIQAFKAKDTIKISQMVEYPLRRDIPLPSVKNEKEMQARFSQVFDTKLQNKIANSTTSDWGQVGWRGIMFGPGDVWITNVDNDEDKNAIAKIIAVNHTNEVEQKLLEQNLAAQKKYLHPSLREFASPALLFKTSDYLVRIDLLKNEKYRYAAWKGHQDQSKKPDLVLNNGELEILGTIRDQQYQFKSGPYTYEALFTHYAGETDSEVSLIVYKGEDIILEQAGALKDY